MQSEKIKKGKKIVKEYAKQLKAEKYPISGVYLFGSYANGKAGKWSDIDVAVISKKNKVNYWGDYKFLSKVGLQVDTRIEPHGFTRQDFKNDCDPMVYEIKKTGIRVV